MTVLVALGFNSGSERLAVEKDLKAIERALQASRQQDNFRLVVRHSPTFGGFAHDVHDLCPDIIYVATHGRHDGSLSFARDGAGEEFISAEGFRRLFERLSRPPRFVVFMACHSAKVAEVTAKRAQWAIGVEGLVSEEMAPKMTLNLFKRIVAHTELDVPLNPWLAQLICDETEKGGTCTLRSFGTEANELDARLQ